MANINYIIAKCVSVKEAPEGPPPEMQPELQVEKTKCEFCEDEVWITIEARIFKSNNDKVKISCGSCSDKRSEDMINEQFNGENKDKYRELGHALLEGRQLLKGVNEELSKTPAVEMHLKLDNFCTAYELACRGALLSLLRRDHDTFKLSKEKISSLRNRFDDFLSSIKKQMEDAGFFSVSDKNNDEGK